MLRVCKLLLLMFFISPVFAMGEVVNNSSLKAKEVYYDSKNDLVRAKGDVFIEMDSFTLNAQTVIYDLKDDVIFAEGGVQIIDKSGRIMRGDKAIFKDRLKQGAIEGFIAKFDESSILTARLARRLNKNRVSLYLDNDLLLHLHQ